MVQEERSDQELATELAQGSETAFSALFHRYFGRIYDFSLRMIRDRDEAAAVCQTTFLQLYRTGIQGHQDVPFVRAWLFAVAYRESSARLKGGRFVREGEEPFAVPDASLQAQPALAAEAGDLARLVWPVARDLREADYALLDLAVRQEFSAEELGLVFGTSERNMQGRLARLLDLLEESYSALILITRGRRECLDLDFLVGDEAWSPGLRKRVHRHLQGCESCQGTRSRYGAAATILHGLALVPPPVGWETAIHTRLLEAGRAGIEPAGPLPYAPAAAGAAPPPPVPTPIPATAGMGSYGGESWLTRAFGEGRGPLLIGLGIALLLIIIAIGAYCAVSGGGGNGEPTGTPTTTGTATATETPSPTITPTVTPTDTPLPPTDTPLPTDTPVPTVPPPDTPTAPPPAPPTDTPAGP
jgi:DNA-directed RNA polymerase specialized sigma24 family protein